MHPAFSPNFPQLNLMPRYLISHPSFLCKLVSALLAFLLLLNAKEAHAVLAREQQRRQGEPVFQALQEAGYHALAAALQDAHVRLPPLHDTTFFAPTDGALASTVLTSARIMEVLDLHTVGQRLTFEDLLHLPLGCMLHTFHPDIELAVTSVSNATHRFAISGVSVADPEIYNDNILTIHGVESLFRPIASGLNGFSGDRGALLEAKPSESSIVSIKSATSARTFARQRNLQSAMPGYRQELYPRSRSPKRNCPCPKKSPSTCKKGTPKYYSTCDESSATGKMSILTLRWLHN